MSRVGRLGPGHIVDLLMHADVIPFPNFALDLTFFALLCTLHSLFSTWTLPLQLPYLDFRL